MALGSARRDSLMRLRDSFFNQAVTDTLFSWDFTCRTFLLDPSSAQEVIPTCSGSWMCPGCS